MVRDVTCQTLWLSKSMVRMLSVLLYGCQNLWFAMLSVKLYDCQNLWFAMLSVKLYGCQNLWFVCLVLYSMIIEIYGS